MTKSVSSGLRLSGKCRDAFFIGRGIDYAISMEGSLKMKEVSYVHTEAYAAGETETWLNLSD